jgi:hypothetical protein
VNHAITNVRGYIYVHPSLPLSALRALLKNNVRWAYVANLAQAKIVAWDSGLPARWPEGRAFGAEAFDFDTPSGMEVRWSLREEEAGCYRVTILTETLNPSWTQDEGWESREVEGYGLRKRRIMLWGELSRERRADAPPTWIEIRIPQPIIYPVAVEDVKDVSSNSPALHVFLQSYDYTLNGVPVTTRWAWLNQGPEIGGET